MRGRRGAAALGLGALALVAGVILSLDPREVSMSDSIAVGYRGEAAFEPFPDDIAAVEEAWGEPIPASMERVGGPAEWGWAAMRYEIDGDALRFFGRFRNWRRRYEGEFVLYGGKDDLSAETIFTDYHMSSIDGISILFQESKGPPPMDHFRLRAKYPDQVEVSTAAAD